MDAGMEFNAALTATCFGAAIMTIMMGLVANRPLALAPGMGINAIVAYTLCIAMGLDWRVAMGVVVLEGIIILILVVCGLRRAIMIAIPSDLRLAIGIGIGLFIAFIGLKGGSIVSPSPSTLITVGEFTSPACIVSFISIITAIILHARKVPGALLISIVPVLFMLNNTVYYMVSNVYAFIGLVTGCYSAVMVSDYLFVSKGKFRLREFFSLKKGYQFAKGWNPAAIIAVACGLCTYLIILNPLTWVSYSGIFPYTTAILPTIFVTGIVYTALMKNWILKKYKMPFVNDYEIEDEA
jgi:xanthine/uracil/vitamin C permease (AzgA family)